MEALDARHPVIRPIPHVAILRDEFTQLFSDDYEEEEEEMEARGEHTLSEKFGGHFAALVNGILCLELFRISLACWVYLCLVSVPTGLVECFFYVHRTCVPAQPHLALPPPAHGGFPCPAAPRCRGAGSSPAAPLVAVCLERTFGPDCSLTCQDCRNGGTCNAEGTGCDCAAGWTGVLCNQSE